MSTFKENEIAKHQRVLETAKMLVIIRLNKRICSDVVIIQYMYIKSLSLSLLHTHTHTHIHTQSYKWLTHMVRGQQKSHKQMHIGSF